MGVKSGLKEEGEKYKGNKGKNSFGAKKKVKDTT